MVDHAPAKPGPAGIFFELRPRLSRGLLVVRKDVAPRPGDVQVTGGHLSLCVRTPRGNVTLTLPDDVSVEEGSCVPTAAGESSCGDELHFRLNVGSHEGSHREAGGSVMEMLRANEAYCFHCQRCMTRLLEDRVFKRVLPLPNGNWNSIVDDWCCHPDPFNKKLLPRPHDCLMGDTFVLVSRDGTCEDTLTEDVSSVAADHDNAKKPCRRLRPTACSCCSLVLGEVVSSESLKLYVTQVVVERAEGDRKSQDLLSRSAFVERTMAARLQRLSGSLSCFHFSVQTPDGTTTLLLWLLNSDSIVASVPGACVDEDGSSSCSAQHGSAHGAARALKVLFISCSDANAQQREIVTSWDSNATGHPVVLPPEVCEELLEVLVSSNSALPGCMRSMRCYQVAHLML